MNAFSTTARDLAATLLGTKRAKQDVRVVAKAFGGFEPRFTVLVTPEGCDAGDYYEVRERTLEALRAGATPADLDLYPVDPEDEEASFGGDYCHADNFRQLLRGAR